MTKKLEVGMKVHLYRNTYYNGGLAYERVKNKVYPVYEIVYVPSWQNSDVELRMYNKNGKLGSHCYFVPAVNVIPVEIFNKTLEDYL